MDKNNIDITIKNSKVSENTTKRFQMVYFRLRQLVKKMFNIDLKYKSFPLETLKNEKVLMALLKNNNPLILIDKAIYPVYLNDLMIGVAEAKGATKLTKANLSKLNTLAKLLSFGEDKIDRIETLSAIENQLALNHSEQKNNVVFLNQFKEGTDLKVNIIKNKERTEEIFNFSSVILSNNYDDLYKLSLELHSLSKRYAFLRYDDLDKTNNSLEEVNKIGAATLFIPEIKDLSSQDISVVKDIINKNHSADLPKVIICTAYNKDLVSDILGNDTFNQLSYFNMNLGFNHYKNIGLKDYFYNSITENQVIKN